jgi:sugar fermentation stimulation protein A
MKNCIVAGSECWLSISTNPKRKYAYTWELATTPTGHLACVNTQQANKIVAQALTQGLILELACYTHARSEVKYGMASRIDFY